jgi:hypothetical protein
MKNLLLIWLFCFLCSSLSLAQTPNENEATQTINQGYYEVNFGLALIDGDIEAPFPGISLLIGNKSYFKNNIIVDVEIGLALPSIGTAKLGIGYKTRSSEFTIGIRPWPMHFYLQTQLNSKLKGGWIMSVEISPYLFNRTYGETAQKLSMQSYGMLNFGYRWNITEK